MYKILLFFFLLTYNAISQSLGEYRIKKLNNTVVRISIDSTGSSGTGFIFTKEGWIATNNHVIQPAFYRNKETNRIDSLRGIRAEFNNKKIIEYVVLSDYYGKDYKDGLQKDYIILIPRENTNKNYDFLKIGKWEDIDEGDEVYTAGYPLSIRQRVISKGLFSTKYVETKYIKSKKGQYAYERNQAWVDFTLNAGNSGGPVIKIGKKPKDDIVIGLATFLWNPYAQNSSALSKAIIEFEKKNNTKGLTTNKVVAYALEALSKNSLGLSGAVPSDGIYLKLQQLNRER